VQKILPLVPVYNDLLQCCGWSYFSIVKKHLFFIIWFVVDATAGSHCVDEGTGRMGQRLALCCCPGVWTVCVRRIQDVHWISSFESLF